MLCYQRQARQGEEQSDKGKKQEQEARKAAEECSAATDAVVHAAQFSNALEKRDLRRPISTGLSHILRCAHAHGVRLAECLGQQDQ